MSDVYCMESDGDSYESIYPTKSSLGEIFHIDGVLLSIFSMLKPADSLQLLQTSSSLYFNTMPWLILQHLMNLNSILHLPVITSLGLHQSPRLLVIHAFKKLGYNCTTCYSPLDGPNGYFACTNLCTSCSMKKLKNEKSPYVDGTIRFFLCGKESIITRGLAFVTYPYWVSTDDAYKKVAYLGHPFELAHKAFEEKLFFQDYAPLDVPRPEDDKPLTLRRMIELSDVLSKSEGGMDDSDGTMDSHWVWVDNLPESLKEIYEEQKESYFSGLDKPNPLGAQRLKELAQSMHTRLVSNLKYL